MDKLLCCEPRSSKKASAHVASGTARCPREYKLDAQENSMLTNAEFYGGIEQSTVLENFSHNLSNESNNFVSGLLMTKRINTWDVGSYLKLSAVLEMYYSEYGIHRDTRFRGCNRLNNYRDPTLIDQPQLKEQVNLLTSINRR